MKSISILALFFVLFLVLFVTPKVEANDDECLKEYFPQGYEIPAYRACTEPDNPSLCYVTCQQERGAKGGKCKGEKKDLENIQCFCDYCSDDRLPLLFFFEPTPPLNSSRSAFA
ncbi:unnamed protein product [Microthlaspi erraticum]|uniref:Knottin scorpion toxin-like domain-containing protein n=1 Tax=Microthlaspi erraticum TaxID=1685480 RepID=A0A6D2IBS3_9BRAS|nr:unnamed protein product [Microthlaspi erraticum]